MGLTHCYKTTVFLHLYTYADIVATGNYSGTGMRNLNTLPVKMLALGYYTVATFRKSALIR